jgi:hypothetical protein
MKTIKIIKFNILIFVFALLTNSCKKAITDFTIDKTDYSAGDVINIRNQTKNLKTYKWTIKAASNYSYYNKSYSDQNPSIRINPCAVDGNYSLILSGTTKRGRTSTTTRDFLVKTIRGSVYIYSPSLKVNADPIEIRADNEVVGKLYPQSGLSLKMAIGVRYLTTGNGKIITLNIQENGYYSWNIDQ